MKKYLLPTAIIALTFSASLLGMEEKENPIIKKTNPDHESLLRHIAVVRALKKRSLNKETEEIDKTWAPLLQGKNLNELEEYLNDTATGKLLISYSQLRNMSIIDASKALIGHVTLRPNLTDEIYNILEKCIKNEIKYNKDYYVFYNSSKDIIRFTFDIITEFSSYFLIDPLHETLQLRFSIGETPPYFNSMKDYLRTFFMPGKNGGGSGDDHSPFARKTQISANFSLLSANKREESTLAYFVDNQNISDPSMETLRSVLTFYLKDPNLVQKRIQKYMDLYNETVSSKSGASLLQIFIKKDKVDSLAYISQAQGVPYVIYPEVGLVPIKKNYRWKPGSIENFIPLKERNNICRTIFKDIYSKLNNPQQIGEQDLENAKKSLEKAEADLKYYFDEDDPMDPLGEFMKEVATTLQNNLNQSNLNDDVNPFIIYKNKIESHNSTTLFPVSEFLSQHFNLRQDELNPYTTQARILMAPNFINPDVVKIKIMTANDTDNHSKDLALYRKKLAELVLQDVAYYLEHAPKHELQGSKLGVLKEYVEGRKEIERPSSPIGSSQEYDDPEFKGLEQISE